MKVRLDAVRLAVVVLLGVFVSLVLWLSVPGVFGLTEDLPRPRRVMATVTKGAGCGDAAGGETVTFVHDGREHQATLDACGHRQGEPVEVGMPDDLGQQELVVHASEAATGESDARRPVAFVLFLSACLAGGFFQYLQLTLLADAR